MPLHRRLVALSTLAVVMAVLVGCGTASVGTAVTPSTTPAPTVTNDLLTTAACPTDMPTGTRCWRGVDDAGAHVLVALPEHWSGVLVVHAHGGPELGTPRAVRADEDAKRWRIVLEQGHAWAASVFGQSGFAVSAAAQDTERVRQWFVQHVRKPRPRCCTASPTARWWPCAPLSSFRRRGTACC
jgi:hypothetical protein